MYKPVLEMLKKREDDIKKGIKQSEEGKLTLENALEQEKKIIEKAQIRAEKIVSDSRQDAEEERVKIEEAAKRESERMLLTARETIEKETREAEERLTAKIGDIALNLLEKSLVGIFGKKEQEEIMKKAVAQIKK